MRVHTSARARFAIGLCIVLGFVGPVIGADIDLQEYGGTPTWSSDLTAASTLLPRDGKRITADSNTAGAAPVNRSLKQLKNLMEGMHDGIFGSRAGSTLRTVRSLHVDGLGGNTSGAGNSDVRVTSAGVLKFEVDGPTGNIEAQGTSHLVGQITGDAGIDVFSRIWGRTATSDLLLGPLFATEMLLTTKRLAWIGTGTGSADGNPPRGVSVANELRAKNTLKYWMRVKSTAGTIGTKEGVGDWDAAIVDLGGGATTRHRIRFTLNSSMDNANYSPVCQQLGGDGGGVYIITVHTDTMTASRFDVSLWDPPSGLWANVGAVDSDVTCQVHGQQTT